MRNRPEVAQQMRSLAALGVHFSVADFGSSYSCLSHLHQLPVSTLKIDCSFVERVSDPNGTYTIVQAIIALAHGLGLRVVAEGVERADQMECLRTLGCDFLQGRLLAPVLPGCQYSQVPGACGAPGRQTFAPLTSSLPELSLFPASNPSLTAAVTRPSVCFGDDESSWFSQRTAQCSRPAGGELFSCRRADRAGPIPRGLSCRGRMATWTRRRRADRRRRRHRSAANTRGSHRGSGR